MRIRHLAILSLMLLAACTGGGGPESEPVPTPTPGTAAVAHKNANVFVIVASNVGADHLACYGAARGTSPNIDRLAEEGVRFESAISSAPATWQAWASLLTGLYPPKHGVRFDGDAPLAPGIATLPRLLSERSYTTAIFDAQGVVEEIVGRNAFDTSFSAPDLPTTHATDESLIEQAVGWFGVEARERPTLAVVRLNGARWPYHPKPHYHEFLAAGEEGPHDFNDATHPAALTSKKDGKPKAADLEARRKLIFGPMPEPLRAHMELHYDAAVRSTDDAIGLAVQGLRDSGLLDTTVLVITADHGESLGTNGYVGHGPRVDDRVLRVPLVVRMPPGVSAAAVGRVVPNLVRTVDLVPTILAIAGLENPASLSGVSVLGSMAGTETLQLLAYAESDEEAPEVDSQRPLAGVAGKHRILRSDQWKLYLKPDATTRHYEMLDVRSLANETPIEGESLIDIRNELQVALEAIIDDDPRGAPPKPTPTPEVYDDLLDIDEPLPAPR